MNKYEPTSREFCEVDTEYERLCLMRGKRGDNGSVASFWKNGRTESLARRHRVSDQAARCHWFPLCCAPDSLKKVNNALVAPVAPKAPTHKVKQRALSLSGVLQVAESAWVESKRVSSIAGATDMSPSSAKYGDYIGDLDNVAEDADSNGWLVLQGNAGVMLLSPKS